MSEKALRSQLKQPDPFQRAGGEARDWLAGRQKWVAGACVALVAVGGGIALSQYASSRGKAHASLELSEALKPLGRSVEGQGAAAPPALPGEPAPFKTQTEKDQAVAESLAAFRTSHPSTPSAVTAALPLGQALNRLGRHDEALQAFDAFLQGTLSGDPLRASAYEGRGYTFEAQGKWEEALAAFDAVAKESSGEFLAGMGLYHRARVLAATNRKEEAAKVLAQVSTEFPNSAAARMSKERLSVLAAEGIKPPPAAPTADAGQG
ncbi:MAG TPA: tetratricopeptide repeat protein [Myxococcaceae bacterium]|nr:tetratricopeptide repeat protein [Myxococcaceae bacterium]